MKLRETRRLKCQASRAKTYRTTFHTQNLRIDTVSHCSNSPESSRRHWRLCWREKGLRRAWHPLRRFRTRRVISIELFWGIGSVGIGRFVETLRKLGFRGPLNVERETEDQRERFRDLAGGVRLLRALARP